MNTHFLPLGAAKCHHMPEDYYARWESLYKAYRRARKSGTPKAAINAAQRLKDHENSHCTN